MKSLIRIKSLGCFIFRGLWRFFKDKEKEYQDYKKDLKEFQKTLDEYEKLGVDVEDFLELRNY